MPHLPAGLRRALAVAALGLLALALIGVRQLTSPTSAGYRVAMAAAPGGGLYLARPAGLLLVRADGTADRVGPVPAPPLSLAADGSLLLLGADPGLFISRDGGRSWSQVGAVRGRFLAVAASGANLLAGAWTGRLWVSEDGGRSWRGADAPAGEAQFEAFAITPTLDLAATETGLLTSGDGGLRWRRAVGLPERMTAAAAGPRGGYLAGDWKGGIFSSRDGRRWSRQASLGAGVWSLAGRWAATASGLYDLASRSWQGPPFGGTEVTAVATSGAYAYASVARGPVYVGKGGHWSPIPKT